jgi:hypothetical protein
MPAKTALSVEQWYAKIKAILPGHFLQDIDQSVLKSHLKGMSAVYRAIEEGLYAHINETFIGRASEEFLLVHASERIIPELGYTGDARRKQIQGILSKTHLEGLRQAVADLLDDETVEVEDGYSLGTTMLDADYDDSEENVVDFLDIPNFFSVVLGAQILSSDSFVGEDSYVGRGAYISSASTGTDPVVERVKNVVDHYKASGTRYRIFQRNPTEPPAFAFDTPGAGFDVGQFLT